MHIRIKTHFGSEVISFLGKQIKHSRLTGKEYMQYCFML